MQERIEQFFKYIKVDTKSNPSSETIPSSKGQLELGDIVLEDIKALGIKDVKKDEFGYIYATLPANSDKKIKTVGFIAHLDTAPDMDGKCENPKIVKYEGGDIRLNDEFSIKTSEFPFLEELKGQTLITTDGTTLLGADNKAGIVIILSAIKYLIDHPEIEHGDIKFAFTPDEEIGKGPLKFDVPGFGADFAYTMDGSEIGGLEYENFNASSATIQIQGKSVHPGSAKNIMINASRVALEIEMMLPQQKKPEYTEGYEGFFMLHGIEGSVDSAKMEYIIRDHDMDKFNEMKELIKGVVDFINKKYGNIAKIELKDTYYNMKEKVSEHMYVVDIAVKSMEDAGVTPNVVPIRGGTDGAQLSFKGLPCPNIFTGGYNYHGRFEFLSVEQMNKAVDVAVKIVENTANYEG